MPYQLVCLRRCTGEPGLARARPAAARADRAADPGTDASSSLRINGGTKYCVPFGGAAGGQIVNNSATSFKVTNPTAQVCSAGD